MSERIFDVTVPSRTVPESVDAQEVGRKLSHASLYALHRALARVAQQSQRKNPECK